MKFAAISAETLKTVKCFPNILFSIGIMDLCLLPCLCIRFKGQLKRVKNVFMSEVVLANVTISEPVDA